jgi:hypothetical protein
VFSHTQQIVLGDSEVNRRQSLDGVPRDADLASFARRGIGTQ